MTLPQVGGALIGWEQPVLVKTVTEDRVDFEPVQIVEGRDVLAVIQPTRKTALNNDTLNWTQPHITLHAREVLAIGELVQRRGADYKIVEVADWLDYGYCEAVAEATNRPVVQVTP